MLMVRSNGHGPENGTKLGVLLAIFEFPMLNAGLRDVIDAEPDMEVIGEVESRETFRDEIERTVAEEVERSTQEAKDGAIPGEDLLMKDVWADGGSQWRN